MIKETGGIDIPANQKFRGGEQLKVTSTDPSGNKSDEKVIDVKDDATSRTDGK